MCFCSPLRNDCRRQEAADGSWRLQDVSAFNSKHSLLRMTFELQMKLKVFMLLQDIPAGPFLSLTVLFRLKNGMKAEKKKHFWETFS